MTRSRNFQPRRAWAHGGASLLAVFAAAANAAEGPKKSVAPAPAPAAAPAPPPAPLGVFGADMPAAGKLVVSVIPQFANLSHTLIGRRTVSSEEVVATTPWFYNPRAKLRLVPQNVAVATQTVALAYGVTKDFSAVLTMGTIERNLDMLTFKGAAGITRLGMSYTGTKGLTDFTLSGVYRVYQDPIHRIQINLGMSFPTGSTQNTFTLLIPNVTYQTSRAFYAMQPGWGTFDIMPGVVYAGHLDKWSWGASYRGRFPLTVNTQSVLGDPVVAIRELVATRLAFSAPGYRWGDLHEFNGWGGYTWIPGFTTTARVNATLQGPIRGYDPNIRGRAQAANPLFYGGQRVEVFGGATIGGKLLGWEPLSLAIEAGLPVYQNLNGPQLSKNWQAGMALRVKI